MKRLVVFTSLLLVLSTLDCASKKDTFTLLFAVFFQSRPTCDSNSNLVNPVTSTDQLLRWTPTSEHDQRFEAYAIGELGSGQAFVLSSATTDIQDYAGALYATKDCPANNAFTAWGHGTPECSYNTAAGTWTCAPGTGVFLYRIMPNTSTTTAPPDIAIRIQ